PSRLSDLQCRLQQVGQFLPGKSIPDDGDLTASAKVAASSTFHLSQLAGGSDWLALDHGWAMLLPLKAGTTPNATFELLSDSEVTLVAALWTTSRPGEYSMGELLERLELPVSNSASAIELNFTSRIAEDGYHFIKLVENPALRVRLSDQRVTGIVSV